MIKSGNNEPSKSTSWKVLDTVMSHLKTRTRINSMMTSRLTSEFRVFGSRNWKLKMFICYTYSRSLWGLQVVKGNPHSRYLKQVLIELTWQFVQVHQSRLPRRDRAVSSAVYSTASGGSWAMFESLSSSGEVLYCGSNIHGRITPSDSISNSNDALLSLDISLVFCRQLLQVD